MAKRPRLVTSAARSIRSARGALRAAGARVGGLPPAGDIQVSYGHARVPKPFEHAAGGIVKLQALEREFPNAARRFNILYLVSSRLPEAPVALARAARAKHAAGIDEREGNSLPLSGLRDNIARGSGNWRHDGTPRVRDSIEKG